MKYRSFKIVEKDTTNTIQFAGGRGWMALGSGPVIFKAHAIIEGCNKKPWMMSEQEIREEGKKIADLMGWDLVETEHEWVERIAPDFSEYEDYWC